MEWKAGGVIVLPPEQVQAMQGPTEQMQVAHVAFQEASRMLALANTAMLETLKEFYPALRGWDFTYNHQTGVIMLQRLREVGQ